MDIKNSISIFESEYDEKFDETKDEELRQEFVKTFPKDEMKNMELEDYALGKRDNNLCWWLEFNTINLGSIRGGSSAKYRIYFSKKNNKWEYVDKEFNDEREAWNSLRLNINNFIIKFEKGDYQGIKDEELDSTLKALKLKLLYMYFPDKVIPIYSESHLHRILIDFGFDEEKVKNYSSFEANLRLKEYKDNSLEFSSWSGLKFMRYIYSNKKHQVNIYKVAPGHDAVYWEECYNNGYICIGWDNIGDLTQYTSYEEFKESFIKNYGEEYKFNKRKITEKVNEIWTFYNLEPGNIIVANKGTSTVLGIGTVLESGYEFKNTRKKFKHIIHIDWEKNFEVKNIEAQKHWAFKTVAEVSKSLYDKICLDDGTEQNTVDLKRNEKVNFTEDEERFFTEFKKILERKKNVILYGPPGTGKTYLSLKYINWIENNNKKVEKEMCTFHPSFNYEDFIEGYKPSFKDSISQFSLTDGVFKLLCKKASINKETDYYLIIDEINRGNIEKIFGEMITLIEKDKRGQKYSLTLSQSKEEFYVPENVYIIGTMNTTDKSIRMLDAAIRRRFSFKECMPNYDLINEEIDEIQMSPAHILNQINQSLRKIEDREKQIGHSYFMNNSKQIDNIEELKQIYIYDIIPLVSEYCYNDYENMGKIIGEAFIDQDSQELKDELIYGTDDYFSSEIINHFGDKND